MTPTTKASQTPETAQPKQTYCLHGFTFYTPEERQQAAEGHPLWGDFVAFYRRQWDDQSPLMCDLETRALFEFYVDGAYREFTSNANAKAIITQRDDLLAALENFMPVDWTEDDWAHAAASHPGRVAGEFSFGDIITARAAIARAKGQEVRS